MAQPEEKKRTFISLRYVLIIAGAYLFLWSEPVGASPALVALLVAFALGSNVLLAACPARRLLSVAGLLCVVFVDICWISTGLWLTKHLGADLLILYLLVLVSAAASESLVLVTSTAILAGVAYLMVLSATSDGGHVLTTANLMRLPFLFASALVCGYLVEELKRERRAAERNQLFEQTWAKALSTVVRNLQSPVQTMAESLESLQHLQPASSSRSARKTLDEVGANVEYLSLLIDNYLDLARIRARSIPTARNPISLADVINRTVRRFTCSARLRGVEITTKLTADLPRLHTDTAAVERTLANLLHNAIKFSRPGGKVRLAASAANASVEITVSDNGWGIPVEERASLSSLHQSFHPPEDGTPPQLGLHVATHLTEIIGGSIHLESHTMQGSCFSVKLPIDSPAAAGAAQRCHAGTEPDSRPRVTTGEA